MGAWQRFQAGNHDLLASLQLPAQYICIIKYLMRAGRQRPGSPAAPDRRRRVLTGQLLLNQC